MALAVAVAAAAVALVSYPVASEECQKREAAAAHVSDKGAQVETELTVLGHWSGTSPSSLESDL